MPLNVAPSGMNAQVIARRGLFVIFAPAPCAVMPLWKTAVPAFAGAGIGSIFIHSGYTLNSPDKQNLMAWLLQNQTTRGTAWGPLMAGAIITSIPVVIFFLIIQRNIATGLTAGAVKG